MSFKINRVNAIDKNILGMFYGQETLVVLHKLKINPLVLIIEQQYAVNNINASANCQY